MGEEVGDKVPGLKDFLERNGDEELKLWHRQTKEPPRAYYAFKIWMKTPGYNVCHASIAYRNLIAPKSKPVEKGKTPRYFSRWKKEWFWDERRNAYIVEQERLKDEANAAAAMNEAQNWDGREKEWKGTRYEMATKLVKRVNDMLDFPLQQVEKEWTETRADGVHIHHVIIRPTKWRAADAAKYLEVADKLAALSLGKPTDHRKVERTTGGISEEEIDKMSEEELDRLLAEKQARLNDILPAEHRIPSSK